MYSFRKKFDFNANNDNLTTFKIITDMSYAFANCPVLSEFNLSNINSGNNITMNEMFLNCVSLKKIDFSPFFIIIIQKEFIFQICKKYLKIALI